MDELGLIVEGILNKTQKLILRNQLLKEKIQTLQDQNQSLVEQLNEQSAHIKKMEEKLANSHFTSAIGKGNSDQARQKVSELLREVEKCYALLNR
jgi:predicted nuclease with TOPRIM domain